RECFARKTVQADFHRYDIASIRPYNVEIALRRGPADTFPHGGSDIVATDASDAVRFILCVQILSGVDAQKQQGVLGQFVECACYYGVQHISKVSAGGTKAN